MAQLENLMQRHFIDYASYFILDRAIPEILDGLKPVQRRLLHTLFEMNDGRYHKVANVVGETMKLHPHGDASIADALVVLANKEFFIDKQGNFGNVVTGHPAAASRYIECRLTPLALETLFHEELTEFVPSYDGRSREPVRLPSKLPVILMLGSEGIAVGMATKILPHNLKELWEAQIAILRKAKVEIVPDFLQGGSMDVSAYDSGRGKVEVRARIEARDEKHVVITEVPYGTTTETLINSIEAAAQKGRVKVASISDFTTDRVEIEVTLSRGVTAAEVIPQLYAYTDCSVSHSSNLVVIRGRRPVTVTTEQVLEELTRHLQEQIEAELTLQREQLLDRQHWLTLEQVFVEKRVYKRIEEAQTAGEVRSEVKAGMAEWEMLFIRPMVEEDVTRLLDLRIRRISAYDIERNRKEIEELGSGISETEKKLKNLTRTAIAYVEDLLKKYGDQYPRRTRIEAFEQVDKKAVARQSIKLAYDRDTGFFGSEVKGDRFQLQVSEFDLICALARDGTYRIFPPVAKLLLPERLLHCDVFDPEKGEHFVVVYRDARKIAFAKRIHVLKFIRNREYRLIKDRGGRVELLLRPGEAGTVELNFAPAPRQRVKKASFDLATLELTGTGARGTRLSPKPVSKVSHKPKKAPKRKPSGPGKPPTGGTQEPLF